MKCIESTYNYVNKNLKCFHYLPVYQNILNNNADLRVEIFNTIFFFLKSVLNSTQLFNFMT